MPITAGQKIGPYEIVSSLGAGGMGEVYRARDIRLGREVALKILPVEFASSRERLDRFEQEARSASALNHPNIITIYDIGTTDSTSYLSMELVEGKSLRAILDEGPMTVRKIVSVASQLADGLAKAHSAGIVHRDLKPENLMISKDGFLKILDFGLAKMTLAPAQQASHLQTQTGAGMILGTVGYMSPEQASGQTIDFRSDQFSFGTILYEMITEKKPFQRNTPAETMAAIIREDLEPVSALNSQIPQVLGWIVNRCLAKDPDERYASTRDLSRDLQSIRDHISEISTVTGIAPASAPAAKSFRAWIPAAILFAFLAGVIGTYLFLQPTPKEPLKMITLTYSGKDMSPAISPDGKLMAFRSDRDGRPRIWLKQLATGNEAVLSFGPDDYPRFSSDGSTVYFIRFQGNVTSLYRVGVLGGEERQVLSNVQSADPSPDGKRIAVVRWNAGQSELFLVNPDGTGLQSLARFKVLVQYPRWSPKGAKIVAIRAWAGNNTNLEAVVITNVNTKQSKWIHSTWPTAAVWISENRILYGVPQSSTAIGNSGSRASGNVILQDVETEKSKKLFWVPTSGDILEMLGRDKIVSQFSSTRQNLRQVSLADSSKSDRWFTRGNSLDRQPVYSPDGKRILFSSIGSGNLDLMEITVETGAVRRITEDAADDWDPAYTPDGKHILWSSNREGHFEIWIANTDGVEARRITNDGLDAENPTMTRDGRWIVYNSYNPEKFGVWKIHPDGSGATLLFAGFTQWPEVSPDGKYAAFSWGKTSIQDPLVYVHVVEIETGKRTAFEAITERQKTGESIVVAVAGRCRWMPDGKSLAYVDANERGEVGVYTQEFNPQSDTKNTKRPIAGFDPAKPTETFAISPDGAYITIAEIEVLSSLVRVENIPGL